MGGAEEGGGGGVVPDECVWKWVVGRMDKHQGGRLGRPQDDGVRRDVATVRDHSIT